MKQEPLIFVCKAGAITQPSKVALRKAGVVVVEVADPTSCRMLSPTLERRADQMTGIALKAIASQGSQTQGGLLTSAGMVKDEFIKLLAETFK